MAKVENSDYTKKHGKLNKKDEIIYRVRNGKEHAYTVRDEYDGPASEAQTAHRSNFGKINAIVNRIMADPVQAADFEQRMNAANRHATANGKPKPYKTPRQYAYAVIREQIELTPPPPTQLPKGFNLHIRNFADLSTSELYEILKARYAVFTQEQGIIYLDEDNIDYFATHVFIMRGPEVIAYARLFREKAETTFNYPQYTFTSNDAIFCIGRMLTTIRHQGFGTRLMHSVIAEARRQAAQLRAASGAASGAPSSPITRPSSSAPCALLRLHAQLPAIPFYERFGFHPVGESFLEANLPHQLMELSL